MRFDLLTIFPEFFEGPMRMGILGRALLAGKFEFHAHNIRDWTTDKHHCTDDAPYGGGGGMVMLAEPLLRAIRDVRALGDTPEPGEASDVPAVGDVRAVGDTPRPGKPAPVRRAPLIYLSPQGEVLNRRIVHELAAEPRLILLCGAYEGIDERVAELEIDREISIGDYVLTSGEPAALVLINAIARQLEGVLGNAASAPNDSFENGLLDFPHYTRPELVEGLTVPPVLLSGHHANIVRWRRERSLERTARRRPDLLARVELSREDRLFLRSLGVEAPTATADRPAGALPRRPMEEA